ncbi:MAG: WYL domain-containing protein, partial [Selenomonadaceae bacterium]|nr:WYL domain-containing protein [Selenomonadaceae bacterium]
MAVDFDEENILRLLDVKILQILQKHSDSKHPLTQQKIIDYLDADFDGELCDRRSVGKNIRSLQAAGVNIKSTKRGSYIVRDFSESELRM